MSDNTNADSEMLRQILEPLLEDFTYWFGRAQTLLSTQRLTFLSETAQTDLLTRVETALKEVGVASSLFRATEHQVGVDMATMKPWHQLLMECQAVGMRYYRSQSA